MRHILRCSLWISGFVFLMIGVLYSTQIVLRQWSSSEQYAVWYDDLNQAHHGDSHDLPGGRVLTVIENRTSAFWSDRGNLIGGLRQFLFVGFRGKRINATKRTTFYSFMLMNIWGAPIERRFQLIGSYDLASRSETDSPEFQQKFPNNYGHVVLSSVGFNVEHTEAYFYIEHICGLCGGARHVLMRKSRGRWKTVDEQYTWVS